MRSTSSMRYSMKQTASYCSTLIISMSIQSIISMLLQIFCAHCPARRIAYVHVAGHYNEAEDLIVDTHGADVIEPVWDLLEEAYEQFGVLPTLLERDFNIPPYKELMTEVSQIKQYQTKYKIQANSEASHVTA